MATEKFYMVLTSIGLAKLANAQVSGTSVSFTQVAVGDGNGTYYNPTAADTALKNEVWRGNISSITTDTNNPNWIVIEAIIPTTDGGFMVRETGIFDDAGSLIAIGKVPETYKPLAVDGSAKDLYLKSIIEVANSTSVTLKIDPSVVLASRKYVDDKVQIVTTNLSNLQQTVTTLGQTVTTNAETVGTHLDDNTHVKTGDSTPAIQADGGLWFQTGLGESSGNVGGDGLVLMNAVLSDGEPGDTTALWLDYN